MAGKARKSREREARKKIKKARREANQARYATMRDQGVNTKSKRSTLRSRRTRNSPWKHQHRIPFCGNTGCKKCFPRLDRPHVIIQKQSEALFKAWMNKTAIRGKYSSFPLTRPTE